MAFDHYKGSLPPKKIEQRSENFRAFERNIAEESRLEDERFAATIHNRTAAPPVLVEVDKVLNAGERTGESMAGRVRDDRREAQGGLGGRSRWKGVS